MEHTVSPTRLVYQKPVWADITGQSLPVLMALG
jgi:hypothetical protein